MREKIRDSINNTWSNSEQRQRLLKDLIPIVLGVFIGVLASRLEVFKWATSNYSPLGWVVQFLLVFVVFYMHVIVHEFGHFLGGHSVKYEFYSFRIGPLIWEKEKDKVIFRYQKNQGFLDMCVMLPKEEKDLIYKLVVYYSGGLFLNFLMSVVLLIMYFSVGNMHIKFFLAMGWIIGFIMLACNIIPFKSHGLKNDGANVLSLMRKSPQDIAEIMVTYISTQLNSGVRPSELNASLLAPNKYLLDNEMLGIAMNTYRFFHFLEKGNNKKALKYIKLVEANLESYPEAFREEVKYNIFYAYCFLNKNINKAKKLFEEIESKLEKDKTITKFRILMAYELYVNEDLEKALEFGEIGLTLKDESPIKGEGLFEAGQIEIMMREAKALAYVTE